tara:strand:- start:277 stop:498 length:222 start_codon:yes stop_codon:yes gene_type:complete
MKTLTLLMIFLLCTNCSQGWSISGIELTPSDTTTNTVFLEIVDVDSVEHWYHGNISDYNWCYKHEQYEEVMVK